LLAICVIGGSQRAPFASGVLVEVAALAVGSIILARLLLKEQLDPFRTIALGALSSRLILLLGTSIYASNDSFMGLLLFASGGAMSATVGALSCRWRVDPVVTLTVVMVTSLVTFGPYYVWTNGFDRLASVPWTLVLEQAICQGVIAGLVSWLAFLHSARILGLVTASFLPAVTPVTAALLISLLTDEGLHLMQWFLVFLSALGAFLLVTNIKSRP
jgi:drug/metabolite transporter (DMT)-like permease